MPENFEEIVGENIGDNVTLSIRKNHQVLIQIQMTVILMMILTKNQNNKQQQHEPQNPQAQKTQAPIKDNQEKLPKNYQ